MTERKKALRKEMLSQRARLATTTKKEYDRWVCASLLALIEKNNFKHIHAYLPMRKEINIRPLIEQLLAQGRTVVTPKTLPKRKLKNLVLKSLDEVEKGVFGTTHPASGEVFDKHYDLIIVPGLAFDNENNRLGYGGGYYDNFLAQHPKALKVGIFYPFQRADNLPVTPHDIRLDRICVNDEIVFG